MSLPYKHTVVYFIFNQLRGPQEDTLARLLEFSFLPVILKPGSKVDEATLINAANEFGQENIFKNHIRMMERLKRYFITGITSVDHHDKKTKDVYGLIADEFLNRIGEVDKG